MEHLQNILIRQYLPRCLFFAFILVGVSDVSLAQTPKVVENDSGTSGLGSGESDSAEELPPIEVLGATPLSLLDAELGYANLTGSKLRIDAPSSSQLGVNSSQKMQRELSGVYLNQSQNNIFQPDLQYHGFLASPLLGVPQGLSVYQDGARLNDPFGDGVSWSGVPDSAIETIEIVPGSESAFGLNTLGGAILLKTRSGFENPGGKAEILGGSFGRTQFEASQGTKISESSAFFITAQLTDEHGWRDFSPSRLGSVFGNLEYRQDRWEHAVRLSTVGSDLVGNGLVPLDLLRLDRSAIYSRPDSTENYMVMLQANSRYVVREGESFSLMSYLRAGATNTTNGDQFEDDEEGGEEEEEEEENLTDSIQPLDDPLGILNRTYLDQYSFGLSGEWDNRGKIFNLRNRLAVGAELISGFSSFLAKSKLGSFDESRRVFPTSSETFPNSLVDLDTMTLLTGIYATNTLSPTDFLDVTLGGRFNSSSMELDDQVGTELNGNHSFDRFNPSLSLSSQLAETLRSFVSYSESNRAPSPVELSCANPEAPCRLPNAFLSDPPLSQVVANTWQMGLSGMLESASWSASLFHSRLYDDIIFISAGAGTGRGYFDNVGTTKRQGLELGIESRGDRWLSWFANGTVLDAQFDRGFVVTSNSHPDAVNGEISVEKGDSIPGIPRALLKTGISVKLTDDLSILSDVLAVGSQYLRGDEANLLSPLDGYVVMNLSAEMRLTKNLRAVGIVNNLWDTEYDTFGVLGDADELLGPDATNPRFVAPGAPRGYWLSLIYTF